MSEEKQETLVKDNVNKVDVVIIEDDETLANSWTYCAEEKGKKVDVYRDRAKFLENRHKYNKDTTILVNYGLNKTPNGVETAIILGKEGYTDFFMTTGMPEDWLEEHEGHHLPKNLRIFYKRSDIEKVRELLQKWI